MLSQGVVAVAKPLPVRFCCTTNRTSSAGWLNAVAGLWLVGIAAVQIILGRSADNRMQKMALALADEPSLRSAFLQFDTNRDGELDLVELSALLVKLAGGRRA